MLKTKWLVGFDDDLSDVLSIREMVFQVENGEPLEGNCSEIDERSFHLVVSENGQNVACGRFTFVDDNVAKFGKIAVLQEFRGQQIGDFVVRLSIRKACETGRNVQRLDAAETAVEFYKKLGFVEIGERFRKFESIKTQWVEMEHVGDVNGLC